MINIMISFLGLIFSFIYQFHNPVYRAVTIPRSSLFLEETNLIHSLEPPSGGSLKLLTHLNAGSWSYNWLMYISSEDTPDFDEHYYMDYFNMRGMSNVYTNNKFFYLGFYPDNVNCNEGPMYIALFELMYSKRIFNCKIIIQNPHYIMYNSSLKEFKQEIKQLTDSAYVFFKYSELNRPEQIRYYLDWNYENN
tara:strand:+ start:216 stop:794 length:579 start_codon:yes stop_codon:yes gene_type:complete